VEHSPSGERALDPAAELAEPPAELRIGDAESLKALADPLRINLLSVMARRPRHAWSVKELAAELRAAPTRLYHHVNLLEERGLVRVAGSRVVSGIIERRYQVAARRLRVEPGLSMEPDSSVLDLLNSLFDSARDEIREAMAAGLLDGATGKEPSIHVTRAVVRLTPARASQLSDRIEALAAELDEPDAPGAIPHAVLLTVHPVVSTDPDGDG
jgi:DNA-binding transcriptional ArsR family regulator